MPASRAAARGAAAVEVLDLAQAGQRGGLVDNRVGPGAGDGLPHRARIEQVNHDRLRPQPAGVAPCPASGRRRSPGAPGRRAGERAGRRSRRSPPRRTLASCPPCSLAQPADLVQPADEQAGLFALDASAAGWSVAAWSYALCSSAFLSRAVFCGSCLRAWRRMTSGMRSLPIPCPSNSKVMVTRERVPPRPSTLPRAMAVTGMPPELRTSQVL